VTVNTRCGSVFIALFVALASCARPTPPPAPALAPIATASPPPFLVSTDEIPGEFLWRQSVTATHPDGTQHFEAVVQKRCGELVVIGLTPFGARAFTIHQRGLQVESEVEVAPPPFAPEAVLYDLHRVFFADLGAPPADRERTLDRDGEEIRESWQDGRLRQRSYRRLDGRPAGLVRIEYGTDFGPGGPPASVKLRSEWFGYALEIVTLDRLEAPCSDPRAK
jgi:hypothetical protein